MNHFRNLPFAALVLSFVASLLAGCIIPSFEADCSSGSGCESCLENSGCGWCAVGMVAGRCEPGTSFGPENDVLCSGDWYFSSCEEPSQACNDTCTYANDDSCDEPYLCDPGTDCTDCR